MSKRTLKNRFTVNDWKTTKTMRKLKRICRWTLISGWGELVRSSQCPFNQTSDVRRSLPAYCPNDRVCDWEKQNMWRLVTIDLSVEFRLFKPANVHGRELLLKTGKMPIYSQRTQRYGALRMTTICNRWPHVEHCRLVFPRSSKWR